MVFNGCFIFKKKSGICIDAGCRFNANDVQINAHQTVEKEDKLDVNREK